MQVYSRVLYRYIYIDNLSSNIPYTVCAKFDLASLIRETEKCT